MISFEPLSNGHADADSWAEAGLSRAGLARFAKAAQQAVKLHGEVDVLLASDRTVRRLNREFRRKDKATDVLSFPAAEELRGIHAGDLAISLETAARQAAEHGHSLRDEVRVLLLHGMLHLAGFDHETDAGEMAACEAQLRAKLRLPVGLIARAGESASQRVSKSAKSKRRSPARMTIRRGTANKKATTHSSTSLRNDKKIKVAA